MTDPIAQEWAECSKEYFGAEVGSLQVDEYRRIFFAGAICAYSVLMEPLSAGDQDAFMTTKKAIAEEFRRHLCATTGGTVQ